MSYLITLLLLIVSSYVYVKCDKALKRLKQIEQHYKKVVSK